VAVPSDKLILTVPEAAGLLQIGRDQAYNLCHVDGFPAVRIGKHIRIPRDQLMEWIADQTGKSVVID